jgi:hypothetical protein
MPHAKLTHVALYGAKTVKAVTHPICILMVACSNLRLDTDYPQ